MDMCRMPFLPHCTKIHIYLGREIMLLWQKLYLLTNLEHYPYTFYEMVTGMIGGCENSGYLVIQSDLGD